MRDIVLVVKKMSRDAESVVTWLVSNGILGTGISSALKIVESGKATDEELATLRDVLHLIDAKDWSDGVWRTMNNELCVVFVEMTDADRIFAPDVAWSDDFSGVMRVARNPLFRRYAFHRNRTMSKYASMIEKVKELYARGYDKSVWDEFGARLDAEVNDGGWRFGPNFVGRKSLTDMMPAWRSIGVSNARGEFSLSAAETVVAAERFRRKAGAYPKSLSELVPEYLPSVPEDPFKKGAALNYDAARGVIWTVGADGKFDGKPVNPKAEGKPGWGVYGRENCLYIVNIDGSSTK